MARPHRTGMLFATSAVASSMLASSCSDPPCGQEGFDVVAGTEAVLDVLVSDVACNGVVPSCIASDDAGACTKWWVLPNDTGNCHVDVDLGNGTRFSADVKIGHGSGSCTGFYPSIAADSIIEVP
jgi:hypothetical protein